MAWSHKQRQCTACTNATCGRDSRGIQASESTASKQNKFLERNLQNYYHALLQLCILTPACQLPSSIQQLADCNASSLQTVSWEPDILLFNLLGPCIVSQWWVDTTSWLALAPTRGRQLLGPLAKSIVIFGSPQKISSISKGDSAHPLNSASFLQLTELLVLNTKK